MGNKLILATRNPEKLGELRRILEAGRVPVDVSDTGEFPDLPEVAETGLTFT
ncbi:MAG TPA: non-canonical purine NTP pyrophosphatase, partial [Streptosporangiaceae bacterium]